MVLFLIITGTAYSNFTVKSGDMKILSSYNNSYGADFVDAQNLLVFGGNEHYLLYCSFYELLRITNY